MSAGLVLRNRRKTRQRLGSRHLAPLTFALPQVQRSSIFSSLHHSPHRAAGSDATRPSIATYSIDMDAAPASPTSSINSAGGSLFSMGFVGLLGTQFLTALNDNIFR